MCSEEKIESTQNNVVTGDVLNISKGGCLVTSPRSFEPETILYLNITLPEQGDAENLEMVIKSCHKEEEEYHLGMNFADLINPAYKKVSTYLENLKMLQVRI